ncbi:hypothetical protein [Aureimonas leprariae]|uniref:Uncharacterized protein n=1 Tax=Plantimonas leprariae TaxID=2615207 RepID=A0A7V7PPV1_9HYPH|nr:hypothetical protein [Aureimonas leprariae]KAB0680118.1 hypothetical protein F6X38_09945 [Aureimonas leprariae]
MPFSRRIAVYALAASALLAGATASSAFSKLGREDGSLPTEDGVIATPLPPLAQPGSKQPEAKPQNDAANPRADQPAAQSAPANSDPTTTGATSEPPPAAATPDASTPPTAAQPGETAPSEDGEDAAPADEGAEKGTDPAASQQATPQEPVGPPPDVVYGEEGLPGPVRDLRAKLIEIAKSGDIEKLRPYIEAGDDGTVLSFGGVQGDPIEYLKSSSGDGEGVETLAILLEVLEAGHIRNEPNTENEIYVWPYFSGLAIDKLTKPQKVELFELVTAGDYQEMVGFGAYNFYRVGISPDGKLQFFVAGD